MIPEFIGNDNNLSCSLLVEICFYVPVRRGQIFPKKYGLGRVSNVGYRSAGPVLGDCRLSEQ